MSHQPRVMDIGQVFAHKLSRRRFFDLFPKGPDANHLRTRQGSTNSGRSHFRAIL